MPTDALQTSFPVGAVVPCTGCTSWTKSTAWLAAVAVVFQPCPSKCRRGLYCCALFAAAVVLYSMMPSVDVVPIDCNVSIVEPRVIEVWNAGAAVLDVLLPNTL